MAIKNKSNRKREIDISGPAGNACCLLGQAKRLSVELRKNWDDISDEMTSGDYENLIQVFDNHFGDYVDLVR